MEKIIQLSVADQVTPDGFVVRGQRDGYWLSHTHYFDLMGKRVEADLRNVTPKWATEHREYDEIRYFNMPGAVAEPPEAMPNLSAEVRSKCPFDPKNILGLSRREQMGLALQDVVSAQDGVNRARTQLTDSYTRLAAATKRLQEMTERL